MKKFKVIVTLKDYDSCEDCPLLGIRTGGSPPFCEEGFGDPIKMPWRDKANLEGMYFKRPKKCLDFMEKSGNVIHLKPQENKVDEV